MKTIAFLIYLCCCFLASGCSDKSATPTSAPTVLVKTTVIGSDDTQTIRSYPGVVAASDSVNLSFLVSGRLIELPVFEGDTVKKGILLARIDPKDYQIKVDQQKAKYDLAKITFERYKKLLPTDAISKAQYDEKKSLYHLAKANLAEAKKKLSDTYLFAPFTGVVAVKYVDNHQYVMARQQIISLQNLSSLEVIINIPEEDVTKAENIKKLIDATGKERVGNIEFASLKDKSFPAYFKEAQFEADQQSQTYKITLTTPMPSNKKILPGMTATVKVEFSTKTPFYLVSPQAVAVDNQGKHYVWIINPKTQRVYRQKIQVGGLSYNKIKIIEGVKKGDEIVIAGIAQLEKNQQVKVIKGRIGH